MKTFYRNRQRRYYGPVHWGYGLILFLNQSRIQEFKAFLDDVVGNENYRWKYSGTEIWYGFHHKIFFYDPNHVMRVKLMWEECQEFKNYEALKKLALKIQLNSNFGTVRASGTPLSKAGNGQGFQPYQKLLARSINDLVHDVRWRDQNRKNSAGSSFSKPAYAFTLPKWKRRKKNRKRAF